jgi:hypothetical protein
MVLGAPFFNFGVDFKALVVTVQLVKDMVSKL